MRYFVNPFFEVDTTDNEENIKELEKCGNCFREYRIAVMACEAFQRLAKIYNQ